MNEAINIRPGVGILGLFPAMNYRAWYALGELVDNAIDSYLRCEDKLRSMEGPGFQLRVVIRVEAADGGLIRVWDNAGGISSGDYKRAFVAAEPPPESAGLSQFGIGMKSASCWFAREWRVRSKALGERVERTVEFDVPDIIRRNVNTLEATSDPARPNEHFTEVRLWNLYKPPHTKTIDKMRRHLASMYRQFLRRGDVVIEFNGEELKFEDPNLLVAPFYKEPDSSPREWRKSIEFRLSTGERVTGFVALRDKGSVRDAGLSLYRHGRLIVGSDDDAYRPTEIFGASNKYASQRVFGELHLDDFDVTHTKDGFLWGDREAEFLKLLRREVDARPLRILQQAEGHRAKKATPELTAAARDAAARTAAVLPSATPLIERQAAHPTKTTRPPPDYGATSIASSKRLELTIKGERWVVDIDTTSDPAATEWVEIRDRPSSRKTRNIGILFSSSHPFNLRFGGTTADEIEGLVRVAVGLAIAEITAREGGASMAGVVRKNLNELLGNVLARQ